MKTNEFDGQVAIVTGAGQGIGLEIARQLASKGACVLLNDVDPGLAEKATAQINTKGGRSFPLAGDAGDIQFIEEMVGQAVKQFGKLTIAVANAGITLFGEFLEYPVSSLQKVMHVNLQGSFFLAQMAARQMIRQKSGGSILLMSSVTGIQAHQHLAAYGMTKAALKMLAKNLVIDLSPHQITINTIAPGATVTERTLADPEYLKSWSGITPMGRPATVEDIAAAALFMVSPPAKHITGQNLTIDGGWTSVSPSPY